MRTFEFPPTVFANGDVSLGWLSDGQELLRAERGRPIQVWDVITGDLREGPPTDGIASWSPDHRALAVIADGAVELLDRKLSKVMRRLHAGVSQMYPPTALAWSPDSQRIALAGKQWVELWNPRTGQLLRRVDVPYWARFITFSPDSQLLAIDAPGLHILNGETLGVAMQGDAVQEPNGPGGLAFHPSLPLLAALSDDSTAVEINELVDTGKLDESAQRSVKRERPPESPNVDQPVSIPVAPDELIRALRQKECMLFAGAGLSARAGLPIWFEFVEKFFRWAKAEKWFDDKYALALEENMRAGDINNVADAVSGLAAATGTPQEQQRFADMQDFLTNLLATPTTQLSHAHHLLHLLPFRAVLTTNLDNLLEQTFDTPALTHSDAERLLEFLSKGEFFLAKLYGTVERPETVVLSQSGYEQSLATNRWLAKLMESIFVSQTLLFLGASIDGIFDYLNGLRFHTSAGREHFALLGVQGEAWRVKADNLKRRFNITVIPYDVNAGHDIFEVFVESLVDSVRASEPAAATPTESKPSHEPLLQRVTLKNIGPFDDLVLDLTAGWSVVLGGNGVGKSSILRAIAVGLSGEDARQYAARLVKKGRTHATITLRTAQREYVTELFGTDSGVEIRSPASPLTVEGWLAVGFPALRSMTWERGRTRDAASKARPSSADLIPLIRGDPDPRPDEFKTWLLESAGAAGSDPGLLERLTGALATLTPGLAVAFEKVDAGAREISVKTNEVVLPLETISQGTASLLGWVGVFLQRQSEIQGASGNGDAWDRPALILIDEVDAHMHPRWQQALIPAMTARFPNLQVLATTHSSLIISSLVAEQLTGLKRSEDGAIQVIRPQTGMQGFRTDQIQTGELFDLEDTVDPETRRLLEEYADLLSLRQLDPVQEVHLREVAGKLEVRTPSAEQRHEAREAAELIREYMSDRLKQRSTEEAEKLMREVRVQLTNALAGNHTPG
jgi:hypothetical protein